MVSLLALVVLLGLGQTAFLAILPPRLPLADERGVWWITEGCFALTTAANWALLPLLLRISSPAPLRRSGVIAGAALFASATLRALLAIPGVVGVIHDIAGHSAVNHAWGLLDMVERLTLLFAAVAAARLAGRRAPTGLVTAIGALFVCAFALRFVPTLRGLPSWAGFAATAGMAAVWYRATQATPTAGAPGTSEWMRPAAGLDDLQRAIRWSIRMTLALVMGAVLSAVTQRAHPLVVVAAVCVIQSFGVGFLGLRALVRWSTAPARSNARPLALGAATCGFASLGALPLAIERLQSFSPTSGPDLHFEHSGVALALASLLPIATLFLLMASLIRAARSERDDDLASRVAWARALWIAAAVMNLVAMALAVVSSQEANGSAVGGAAVAAGVVSLLAFLAAMAFVYRFLSVVGDMRARLAPS